MVKRESIDPVAVKEEGVDEEAIDVDNPKEIEVPEICISDDEEEMPEKVTLSPRVLPTSRRTRPRPIALTLS